jgi:exosortase A-associated hydrolase 2
MRLSEVQASKFEPGFIEGSAGRLFTIYHPPRSHRAATAVVYVPPFAEELNRSRRVAALLARRLAAEGCAALLLDLFGCGDSDGDFREARWEIWRRDVIAAVAHLRARGHSRVALIGLRLGALLALDAARDCETVVRVVLWQPVLRGDQMMTQFLRLRLAGGLAAGAAAGENTSQLRARLSAGECLEIAGYEIAPELAAAIDAQRLKELGGQCGRPLDWVAVANEPSPVPQQDQILADWKLRGVEARAHQVVAQRFWSLQETTLAPPLVDLTAALLTRADA